MKTDVPRKRAARDDVGLIAQVELCAETTHLI
jgi:hypothetical protein